MERVDLLFKTIAAFVGTFVSALVGGFGLAFTVLLGMMALDFITGLMVGGGKNGEGLSSSRGTKGLFKKVYVILLIGAIFLVQQVVEIAEFAADGITIAFIVTEFISIVENGGKLGIKYPKPMQRAIKVLKEGL